MKTTSVLSLLLICLVSFFGCGLLTQDLSIGVIGITEEHEYYAPLIDKLELLAENDEYLTVYRKYSNADAALEAVHAEDLAPDVDYLLIVPSATFHDSNNPENVADTVAAAGTTPIIFLDVNPYRDNTDAMPDNVYFFGYQDDNAPAAKLAMMYLAEQMDYSGEVAIIRGPSDKSNSSYWVAQSRVEGAMEAIDSYGGDITIYETVDGSWSFDGGKAAVATWIADEVDTIDAIVCGNDYMALGALSALEDAEITGIKIIGFDGIVLDEIESGAILASISLYVERLAEPAIELVRQIDAREISKKVNDTTPELITTENVSIFQALQ